MLSLDRVRGPGSVRLPGMAVPAGARRLQRTGTGQSRSGDLRQCVGALYHQGVQVMPLLVPRLSTCAQTRKARLAELLVG
ncbi:hypothetical protein QF026_000020 [Streptomyces aurantiacus]|nr:hypothetical protein [Streptomyces aurantiacus]